jgi:RNA polymerase alpha subunit
MNTLNNEAPAVLRTPRGRHQEEPLMQDHHTQPTDEDFARWRAFEPILDAIEEAFDVDGLSATERNALSALYNLVAPILGERPLYVPTEWRLERGIDRQIMRQIEQDVDYETRRTADRSLVNGPDGIAQLGLSARVINPLVGAGVRTVAELRALMADEERLRFVHNIGAGRIAQIREALAHQEARG